MTRNDDITAIVLSELDGALGQETDILSTKRALALDYYQGNLPAPPSSVDEDGNPTQPRNGIVSMDVADTIHSLLAQIQPIVKTTAVQFSPDSQQDEPTAQAESDLVRLQIENYGGFASIFNSVHDALLTGNGWLKIEMEEKKEETEAHYPPLDEMQLFAISMPSSENETKEVEVDKKTGEVTVYTTTTRNELCFESIAPENILYSNTINANGISDLRFVAEIKYFTVSQLLELGISQDKIDSIPDESPATSTVGTSARAGMYNDNNAQSVEECERIKKVYVCFIKLSKNGSNKSELREVWVGGRELLLNEPASYIPYITGSAIPMPHRIEGTGIFELLKTVQDGKTYVLRQYLDNLNVMNSSRLGVMEGQVNMSDLTNGRVNGIVRMRNPNAILPLPSTDIGAQAIQGLSYLDQVRTERVGSSVDFNDAQRQMMQSSATAAAGQLAKVEQMAGWFANNLVNTLIKPAFAMVHRILREESTEPVMAKLRGQWIQMNPNEWKVRKNIDVNMGMTTTERVAKIQALTTVVLQQKELISLGANDVLVNFKNLYNSTADWIRANCLGDPCEYFIDPTSQEAVQAQQMKSQAAQQEQQANDQKIMMLEQFKAQNEFALKKMEIDFKYWEAGHKGEVEQAKMDTDLVVNMQKNETDKEIQMVRTIAEQAKNKVGASGNE